jgi:glucose-1-phosphate cytidylyltransferase
MEIHYYDPDPWRVTLVDTGDYTQTGGRIARIRPYVDDDLFCMTYGDAVSDVDISALTAFHTDSGAAATITAVLPASRFGALDIVDGWVTNFQEKPAHDEALINGGFFVLTPEIFNYIDGDQTYWEHEPLERLAADGKLAAYRHNGFWQPMDTLRERNTLQELWASGNAPWKTW